MGMVLRILCWFGGIAVLIFLASMLLSFSKENCEERIAKRLNTTAVYVNGHCMVKGYGRADGR